MPPFTWFPCRTCQHWPLPETEVTAEPDGELIVKGPQVTPGYYGLQTETIQNGVLRTGDLGTIHDNGHITLHGRKKDFIITAYGKNISITKLEARLKDIPGVSEAVLIGENRPYCTSLIWLEGEVPDLSQKIEQMNGVFDGGSKILIFEQVCCLWSWRDSWDLRQRRQNLDS